MRFIKTFDSLQSMGAQFGGEVFQDISDEALYVFNRVDNEWYQSLWSQSTTPLGIVSSASFRQGVEAQRPFAVL